MTVSITNKFGKTVTIAKEGKIVDHIDISISGHKYKNYGTNKRIEEQLGRRYRYWIQTLQSAE